MAKRPKRASNSGAEEPPASDRVTYRELRNAPGQVWERLANDQPLTLFAEGVPKALVIPIVDGDAATTLEAYRRGRALLAMNRIQAQARKNGTSKLTLDEINTLIRATRRELAREDEE